MKRTEWQYETYDSPLALFPKKAFGYWEYEENANVFQANIEDYIREWKNRDLPLSGIVLEPCWQRDYNELTWNETYPDPAGMIERVNAMGVSIGLWENGWLTPNCANWAEAEARGFLIPESGRNWKGTQPEKSLQFDSRIPECVDWWMSQHEPLLDLNIEGFKLDAGNSRDDTSLTLAAPFAQKAEAYAGRRLFTLKCWGGWARDEEEVAVGLWQGDPLATWQACRDGLLCAILNGLSGQWFFGPEIGALDERRGHHCTPELYQRWAEWGMCAPHPSSMGGRPGREPWKLGPECEATFRKLAKWRMRLTPYVYSYNWNAYRTKEPLMRALAIDFPDDPNCRFDFYEADPMELYMRGMDFTHEFIEIDTPAGAGAGLGLALYSEQENFEFMFGRELLVAPVVWKGATARDVYLPAGTEWIDYRDGKTVYVGGQTLQAYPAALDEMPIFVKAGSIIPMGPDMHTIDEKPCDPLTLAIYPSVAESAIFTLYEDDGVSLEYRDGAYATTAIRCSAMGGNELAVDVGAAAGDFAGKLLQRRVVLEIHRQSAKPSSVQTNGRTLPLFDSPSELEAEAEGWHHDVDRQITTVAYEAATDVAAKTVVQRS